MWIKGKNPSSVAAKRLNLSALSLGKQSQCAGQRSTRQMTLIQPIRHLGLSWSFSLKLGLFANVRWLSYPVTPHQISCWCQDTCVCFIYLWANVFSSKQANCKSKESHDSPLHQEAALVSMNTELAEVVTHRLPHTGDTVSAHKRTHR